MLKKVLGMACSIAMVAALISCGNSAKTIVEESTDESGLDDSRSAWAISGSTFTHDPSIIYEASAGLYWMFYTADGIGVKYSTDGKNWNQGVQVLPNKLSWWSQYVPEKTDFNIWAPDISYYNGKYNLYYSVSTMGKNTSCIGLLQCTSILKGDWVDKGVVIASTRGKNKYNCIDPNFIVSNGTPYLVFGSWYDGIWISRLSTGTLKPNQSPIQIADRDLAANGVEGACIWQAANGYYYLLCSYDVCCRGVNSTYNIRYGRSKNITGPYLDKNGVSMCDNGGVLLLSSRNNQIGPGGQSVFITKNNGAALAYHFYDKNRNGEATLAIRDIKTANGGWISF